MQKNDLSSALNPPPSNFSMFLSSTIKMLKGIKLFSCFQLEIKYPKTADNFIQHMQLTSFQIFCKTSSYGLYRSGTWPVVFLFNCSQKGTFDAVFPNSSTEKICSETMGFSLLNNCMPHLFLTSCLWPSNLSRPMSE